MSEITVDTMRAESVGFSDQELPVKAGEKIVAGSLACVDSSGRAVKGATTAGLKVAGLVRQGYDNTDGADGVLGPAAARYCVVQHGKVWPFAVAGSPVADAPVYLVNNNDLTTVVGNVFAGVIVRPDPNGASGIYDVWIPGVGGPAAAQGGAVVGLTDSTGLSGTHDDTLAATAVPADLTGGESPTEAEHNAALAVMRVMAQNISDVGQKVNEILAALRGAGTISA